jgi:putative inorganic carbon (hco3(-)) transporter
MLACALLLVVFLNFLFSGGHDDQRVLQIVLLWAGGCMLAYRRGTATHFSLLGPGILWPLTGFFALGMLSSTLALSARHGWYETSSLLLLLLVALEIARDIARRPATLTEMLKVFGVIAAVYAFKIIAVYVSVWLVNARPETIDFTPGFSNIRHLNHVQTVGLPLLALLHVLTSGRPRWRALAMGAAVIWWTLLFATGGRGTMLGLVVGTVVVLALRRRAALPLLRTMSAAALMGALVYLVFFWLLPRAMGLPPFGEAACVVGRTLQDPINGRHLLWTCALDLIHQHPWLGVGPLHFAHYGLFHGDAAHPHNWMLQIGAEWGLPALALLCVALAFAVRGLWVAGRRLHADDTDNQASLAAWILTGTAVLMDGMVSGNIVMPQSQLTIVLYIGCAVGWTLSFSRQPASHSSATTAASNIMRIVALIAAVVLACSVGPEFIDRATNGMVSASSAAGHYGSWWTRLWMDTRF